MYMKTIMGLMLAIMMLGCDPPKPKPLTQKTQEITEPLEAETFGFPKRCSALIYLDDAKEHIKK